VPPFLRVMDRADGLWAGDRLAMSRVAFWRKSDTLPLWAKLPAGAATNTTGAGTARPRRAR
jgi:hypothetical protein